MKDPYIHKSALDIRREDFDSDEEYEWALRNFENLYNDAEDSAMEDYYERKYRDD